ncbi:hypothetical protein PG994_014581 [Apiospora phragmitis]|uniref:Thaumatin-like protein n=1 Tax=Apiospora phragmitis TaxID=2905665 RepID=A0ABR1T4R0_9PEZI
MSNTYLFLYLLALVQGTLAAALPWPKKSPTYNQNEIHVTTSCDALYPQDTGSLGLDAAMTEAPAFLAISLVNSHTADISTTHNSNVGAPSPVSGSSLPGTLAAGATAAIAVPTNWAGIISVNDAQYPASEQNSLIEANYQNRTIEKHAIADIDVSYVNGFTLPITCSCNDLGVTGCNKDLFSLSSCPVNTVDGSCANPLRSDLGAGAPNSFFEPCQNAAYTYPNDNRANLQNECQNGQIVCCVGTSCPPSYKQTQD